MGSTAFATRAKGARTEAGAPARKSSGSAGGARAGVPLFLQAAPEAQAEAESEGATTEQVQLKCGTCAREDERERSGRGVVQAKVPERHAPVGEHKGGFIVRVFHAIGERDHIVEAPRGGVQLRERDASGVEPDGV